MSEPLGGPVPPNALVRTGWDFSTGASRRWPSTWMAECLPRSGFLPISGRTAGSELNLMQLEGQARQRRGLAARLQDLGRLQDWVAGGISATHHTAGRIDADHARSVGHSAGTTTRWPNTTPRGSRASAARTGPKN